MVVNWVQLGTAAHPLPVEVLTHERAAIVAYNHSIRVQHWDNFEYVIVSKKDSSIVIAD